MVGLLRIIVYIHICIIFAQRFPIFSVPATPARPHFTPNPSFTHKMILLMEEILHLLLDSLFHSCIYRVIIYPRWCRIFSINSVNYSPPHSSPLFAVTGTCRAFGNLCVQHSQVKGEVWTTNEGVPLDAS